MKRFAKCLQNKNKNNKNKNNNKTITTYKLLDRDARGDPHNSKPRNSLKRMQYGPSLRY